MQQVIKIIILQGFWFLAVIYGPQNPNIILGIIFVILGADFKLFSRSITSSSYIFATLIFGIYGLIQDHLAFHFDLIKYPDDQYPLWLLALWIGLIPYYEKGFRYFYHKPVWIQGLVGAIGGTFAYSSGTRLAGLEILNPAYYGLIFISWGLFFPLSLKIYFEGFMWNKLLDLSVIFSFNASGFKRHAKQFKQDLEFNQSENILITGGTSGIGLATASSLAKDGVAIIVTGRSESRGKSVETDNIKFRALDMGDFKNIKSFVSNLPVLDGLVLNAGGMSHKFDTGDYGIETQARVQLFGHYFLFKEAHLQEKLKPGAKIIWVTSGGMYLAPLRLELFFQDQGVDKVGLYANIKRAQVSLLEKLKQDFTDLSIVAMHPGWAATKALEDSMPGFYNSLKKSLRTPEQGADTIIWCLSKNTELEPGELYFDRKIVSKFMFGFFNKPKDELVNELYEKLNSRFKEFIS